MILTGSLSRTSLPLLKWCPSPVVLVEPHEFDEYRSAHPNVDLVALPESGRGFGYMLNRMVDTVIARGGRHFVFTDDDVTDLRQRDSIEEKFTTVRGAHARMALARVVDEAKRRGVAQLAVSFSGQSWSATKPWVEPTGAWGMYVADAWAIQAVGGFLESVPLFVDYEMSARLLAAGHRVARTNLVTFVHKMNSHEGGAEALYRRAEIVRSAAEEIAALYPEVAKVRFVEAHGLHEVRFNWRKAARLPR